MTEIYTITLDKSCPVFEPHQEKLPECVFTPAFDPLHAPADISLVCRMGSPDVAHCVVFRRQNKPGGIFAMHDGGDFLFAAVAESNLAYAVAKGYFGELAANARAGVDIFEDADGADD